MKEKGKLTGKNGTELQSGRGGTLEELDGDGARVGIGVVPGEGVGRAGGDSLVGEGLGDGVEAGSLSRDGRDESQEGSSGDGGVHFEYG